MNVVLRQLQRLSIALMLGLLLAAPGLALAQQGETPGAAVTYADGNACR
jgi:hypothetical protein